MSQIVFISLFLGLVSGIQTVEIRPDPSVKVVRLELGGREVARLHEAPWSAQIELGRELIPTELTAVGYDAQDHEIARASQLLNVARPAGDVDVVIKTEQRPLQAQLIGHHRLYKRPVSASLSVDGATVTLGKAMDARLPNLDPDIPHVLTAEIRFEDGFVARREVVIAGGATDTVSSELTPVLITSPEPTPKENLENCFSSRGKHLRVSAIDMPEALMVMVKDPDAGYLAQRLRRMVIPNVVSQAPVDRWWETTADQAVMHGQPVRQEPKLDGDTVERIQWLISEPFTASGKPTTMSFPSSGDFRASEYGIYWLLTRGMSPIPAQATRAYADAVAAAGMSTLDRGRRRAVVLILGTAADSSTHAPAVVRRYLERIGVPLFIWSIDPPRTNLADSWGRIEDISTLPKLLTAIDRLKTTLQQQRVVWVATDPLAALNVEVDGRCGWRPMATSRQAPP